MSKLKKEVSTRTEVFDDFLSTSEKKLITPTKTNESQTEAGSLNTEKWFESEEKKPRRVAMTFTLDPEVINLIEKASEKHKLSRSRIIEKIAMNTLSSI